MSKRNKRRITSLAFSLCLLIALLLSAFPAGALTQVQVLPRLSDLPAALSRTLTGIDLSAQVMTRDSLYELAFTDANGLGQIHSFAVPIKFIDDDGSVQYIDTAMESLGWLEQLFSDYDYRNAANSFTVQYSEDPAVGIDFDGDFTTSIQASAVAGDGYATTDQDGNGKWVYPEAFGAHTYVEYINTNRGIKENIVLQQNIGRNTFSFTYRSDTYVPQLINGGEAIRLSAPGQEEYIISPLFVYDSYTPSAENGGSTFRHNTMDCHYLIEQTNEGEYTITYVIDEQWLNSPEVVWPVVVDPSISTSVASSNIKDTYVVEKNPTALYYGYNFVNVGNRSGDNWGKLYAYIQFGTLPTVPSGSRVTDVLFELKAKGTQETGERGACYQVTSSKNINSINWNNQPTYNITALSYSNIKSVPLSTNTAYTCDGYVFDVTSAYNDWIVNNNNYGLRVAYAANTADFNTFHSSEAATAANAPKLTVNYLPRNADNVFQPAENFFIRNVNSSTQPLYLSVSTDNINVEQSAYSGQLEQLWKLSSQDGGWITLSPQKTPQARLYVNTSLSDDNDYGAKVSTTPWGVWEQFRPVEVAQGKYILRSMADAKRVLAADGGNTLQSGGIEFEVYDAANAQSKGQLWKFERRQNLLVYQNKATEKYLSASGTSFQATGTAQQVQQQWMIHQVGDGSVWIESYSAIANAGTGLRLDINVSSGRPMLSAASDAYTQKWKLNYLGDDAFSIVSSYSNMALTWTEGAGLHLSSWTGADNQRWIRSTNKTVNLELLYDHAYITRYPDAVDRILEHATALRDKYLQEFGVLICFTTPQLFTSYADANCYSDPDAPCDHCPPNCTNTDPSHTSDEHCIWDEAAVPTQYNKHHKNVKINLNQLKSPNITMSVKVAFIGHVSCYNHNEEGTVLGLASFVEAKAVIVNTMSEQQERATVVHEFGHFYGAPDHYETDEYGNPKDPEKDHNCIYGCNSQQPSIMTNLTLCNECRSAITANINLFNHLL